MTKVFEADAMAPGEPMFGYTEVATIILLHGTGP